MLLTDSDLLLAIHSNALMQVAGCKSLDASRLMQVAGCKSLDASRLMQVAGCKSLVVVVIVFYIVTADK